MSWTAIRSRGAIFVVLLDGIRGPAGGGLQEWGLTIGHHEGISKTNKSKLQLRPVSTLRPPQTRDFAEITPSTASAQGKFIWDTTLLWRASFQFLVLCEWVQFCLLAFKAQALVVWVPSSWSLMRWEWGESPPSPVWLSAAWLAVGYLEGLLFSCFHVCLFIMAWATAPQTASLINALSGWKW